MECESQNLPDISGRVFLDVTKEINPDKTDFVLFGSKVQREKKIKMFSNKIVGTGSNYFAIY